MMGSRPMNAATTVIVLGRMRFTAPWTMASIRSPAGVHEPALLHVVV